MKYHHHKVRNLNHLSDVMLCLNGLSTKNCKINDISLGDTLDYLVHAPHVRTQNPFLLNSVPGKEMVRMRKGTTSYFLWFKVSQQFGKLTLILSESRSKWQKRTTAAVLQNDDTQWTLTEYLLQARHRYRAQHFTCIS